MIRALKVTLAVMAALAMSIVVWPSPGFGGRGVVAMVVVAVVAGYSWQVARQRDAERRAVIARMLAARRITSRGGAR